MDILQFPYTTPMTLISNFCPTAYNSPLYNWLVWGKIPENPIITPTMREQVVIPSSKSRYLNSVTVVKKAVVNSTITLEVGAEATYTFTEAETLTNTSDNVATATLADGTLTILGVVAGSTTITLKDSNQDTVATIVVTVS